MPETNIAVLLSGGGTTFQYIADRIAEGEIPARISTVISSRADAGGIARAEKLGIPAHIVQRSEFNEKHGPDAVEKFNAEMLRILDGYNPDLILLAGFMSLLSPAFIAAFPNRIMNTHPALIPAFCGHGMYGHHVHEAVISFGAKISGCTIHFVDERYDHGPIILQEAVPVLDDDTADSLSARVQAAEKPLYAKAVRLFCEGRIQVRDDIARIS